MWITSQHGFNHFGRDLDAPWHLPVPPCKKLVIDKVDRVLAYSEYLILEVAPQLRRVRREEDVGLEVALGRPATVVRRADQGEVRRERVV